MIHLLTETTTGMNRLRDSLVLALFAGLLFTACGSQSAAIANGHYVVVRDEQGRPIEGVAVDAAALSIDFDQGRTDSGGMAEIATWYTQKPEWLHLRKPGYCFSQVDYPVSWPVDVVLVRAPAGHEDEVYFPLADKPLGGEAEVELGGIRMNGIPVDELGPRGMLENREVQKPTGD